MPYVKEGQAGYAFTAAERGKIEDEGTICLAIFLWDHVKKLTIKDSESLSS